MRRTAMGPFVGALLGAVVCPRQAASSLSSSATSRRSRAATRMAAQADGLRSESSLELYAEVDDDQVEVPVLSAVERLALRQHARLPWEARHAALSYKVCATDWKFLDRALSALMEMDAAEVSSRSLRLSGRDLLADVVHPVVDLREARAAAVKRKKVKPGRASRRTARAAMGESQHTDVRQSAASAATQTTAPHPPEVSPPSSPTTARATLRTTRKETASTPSRCKPRRRSERTTVRL